MDSRKLRSPPADWWSRFGLKTPELTNFAIRVLCLTCSASGCERNWSTFQTIHTKKRNRLEHQRLNALVYVKYNTRLRERSIRRKQNLDPILIEEIDSDDEWITEKEDPLLPTDSSWLGNEELFNVDVVRVVSSTNEEKNDESVDLDVSSLYLQSRKRKVRQNESNASTSKML